MDYLPGSILKKQERVFGFNIQKMVHQIKTKILRYLSNLPGWRTNRKIVVIESDDWGSIRMPSNQTRIDLQKKGLDLLSGDNYRYNMFDTLATSEDLTLLFEILSSIKDSNNNPCIFTPISLVANPDFEKIRACNFREYYYEPFAETLKRYPGCEKSFDLWREGIEKGLFVPQFHGREHLNVQVWMKALQNNDPQTHLAFEHGMWGFNNIYSANISFQAAFDLDNPAELESQKGVITEGLILFEHLFGYRSTFFVPPNGPFNETLEETAMDSGIKYISASKIQKEPHGNSKYNTKFHYLGQKNKFNQHYITRNCFFEPSQEGRDWVNSCLGEIEIAFRMHKPCIISSHRVNYIGALNTENRGRGLLKLKELLNSIKKAYPDVEFMSSETLGKMISNNY